MKRAQSEHKPLSAVLLWAPVDALGSSALFFEKSGTLPPTRNRMLLNMGVGVGHVCYTIATNPTTGRGPR